MDETPSTAKQFTVTIVGGGIGGLALAIGLIRRGVRVQIYEAASEFKEIGLGLSISPAAHRAMPLIDPHIREIYDSLVTTHADSPGYERFKETWFEVVWATGDRDGEILMPLTAKPSGQTTLRRADFLDALVKLIPEGVAHFGKRLTHLEETTDAIYLSFEDGTSAVADVVVGCDGIHSKVKEYILSPEELKRTEPRYSGMYCYRAILDMDTMSATVGDHRARVSTLYVGHGTYAISYPIARATKVNVGIYVQSPEWKDDKWLRAASKDDMERDCSQMGKLIKALTEEIPDPSQWALFEKPHISSFCKSRICILGDAAHPSTPHQGAGSGQAIEDAHVLAELLSDPIITTPDHVVAAFRGYDAVRRHRSQRVVDSSRENGDLLCLSYKGIGDDREKLREAWTDRFRWLWDIDIKQQAEDARSVMLDALKEMG